MKHSYPVTVAACLAAAALTVVAATVVGQPEARQVKPAAVSAPVPERVLVCPGGPVVGAASGDTEGDRDFQAGADMTVHTPIVAVGEGITAVRVTPLIDAYDSGDTAPERLIDVMAQSAPREDLRDIAGVRIDGTDPIKVVSDAKSAGGARLVGMTTARAVSGDGQGLAAGACLTPQPTTWLVGGSTTSGQNLRLVVANAGDTPATVNVSVLSGGVETAPEAIQQVAVPVDRRREILLGGVAPGASALALRVKTTAGEAVSYLQETSREGVAPSGIDVVAPAAAPSRRVVIPGVGNPSTVVGFARVVNPQNVPAVMSWNYLSEEESSQPVEDTATTVPPRSVVDIPFPETIGEDPGGLVFTADQPIIAAAGLRRVTGSTGGGGDGADDDPLVVRPEERETTDRVWLQGAEPLNSTEERASLVPLPLDEDVETVLTLVADSEASAASTTTVRAAPVSSRGRVGEAAAFTITTGQVRTVRLSDLAAEDAVAVKLWAESGSVFVTHVVTSSVGEGAAQVLGPHRDVGDVPVFVAP